MSANPLNGNPHTSVTARRGAERRHDGDAGAGRIKSAQSLANTVPSVRQRLTAALRQIDALLKLNKCLKEELALLANSLEKERQFAYHDMLTGLPNRRLLLDRFNQAVALANRRHHLVALLFLDLDNFKGINDAVGHSAADRLLQQIALRLSACIRRSDTACRYGGDELVVLLPDVVTPDQARAAAGNIRKQLAAPYDVDGAPVRITASIGIAIYPIDGKNCHDLIKSADMAMYSDKSRSDAVHHWHNGNGSAMTGSRR